ncbi:MAG: DUF4185 domain-containing protein [Candidatus Riflebacteria bacterium]|nr:DUF4185 domain-containing protein [Candidatus Riflebacteria bacterium]
MPGSHSLLPLALVVCGAIRAAGGAPPPLPSVPTLQAVPWPAADRLFRQDPRWLGSDDAYSVDLGEGRVLWLFGDTFIGDGTSTVRATMVSNTVAIQRGYDPSTASIQFFWGHDRGKPRAFFRQPGDVAFWPGHGIRLGHGLLLFMMAIRSAKGGLGFASAGWRAVMVEDSRSAPSEWKLRWLDSPPNDFGAVVGSASVVLHDGFVHAFSSREPGVHDVYLARWPLERAGEGDLSGLQWWAGETRGWVSQSRLVGPPAVLFGNAQTEFSVHRFPGSGQLLEIQSEGFGGTPISARWAPALTGPWSPLVRFYTPVESSWDGTFVYAAKAHPELTGAPVVVTYATNRTDFWRLVGDHGVYYPRFLRVWPRGHDRKGVHR